MSSLTAYRFSAEEMRKMIWLMELFENNGFIIDRFPEVYYDTFENYKKFISNENSNYYDSNKELIDKYYISKLEEKWMNLFEGFLNLNELHEFHLTEIQIKDLKNNLTSDLLGVYVPNFTKEECDCGFLVKEGIVILFKDRIGKIGKMISTIERDNELSIVNSIRFNVLMHEIGHWNTHTAKIFDVPTYTYSNWECNYYPNNKTGLPDVKTHETLAQIINYWCILGDKFQRNIFLNYLTPKRLNSEYNLYLKLIDFQKEKVINKLKIIKKLCDYTDEMKFDFIVSDSDSLQNFIAKEIYKEVKNQGDLGLSADFNGIENSDFILLDYIYNKIVEKNNNNKSPVDFQVVYKDLEQLEDDNPINKLWDVSKSHFGRYTEESAKGASMMKRFGNFGEKNNS